MTPLIFEKNQHTNKLLALCVAAVGLLPGWLSLQTYLDLHQHMDRDPSLGRFIFTAGLMACAFFALGAWMAFKPQRVGLELSFDADGLTFTQALFLRRTQSGFIRWSSVEKIIYQDAPRVGATIQVFDKDAAATWHKTNLAMKLSGANADDILAAMEASAAASGHRLVLDKNLPLLAYTRQVYLVEKAV